MTKDKIIEIVEKVMFEMGYITRPHADATDNFLTELEAELTSLESQDEVTDTCDVCGNVRPAIFFMPQGKFCREHLPCCCDNCNDMEDN